MNKILSSHDVTPAGLGRRPCPCTHVHTPLKFVVVTGGPGAGKTAVLNLARERFCRHVRVLDEAASVVFGGGFPRERALNSRAAAQRAIYHVQVELEAWASGLEEVCVVLCDRGTLDGLAYWPMEPDAYFDQLDTTIEEELQRYANVIHLRTPELGDYNRENPLRLESASEAAAIDKRIFEVWAGHPNRVVIESQDDFLEKARQALAAIWEAIPSCCRDAAYDPGP